MMLLIIAGYALFILPGIYLSIAVSASTSPSQKKAWVSGKLGTSRKAITKFWWRCFWLMLVGILMIIVGSIPCSSDYFGRYPFLAIATGEVF